ncbi:GntR family transcriptional regulator [Arthrobacter sp. NEB 688]|uniref:GntR family transcriptional regulator n=1 Tax=Arthrobacter sp. NEB 688 TaxID=904039 RepID=UPI001563C752|nr:GntR family transcriptional regulator [Arthrobacter sp. NEB 688]QKE85073.1 GntR family transcriptional regulator [Arthrobacter sp. NEB 688]
MSDMLEHSSLPESVHRVLRRRILNNEIPSGARLIEASLASDLGVSRATIREAMRRLAGEGLVKITPRRHSEVTRMSAEDADDVCFARYVLEAGVARTIPVRVRRTLAEPMAAALDEMDAAARAHDVEAIVAADGHFHRLIVQASGRRRACELWAGLDGQMGALMRSSIDRQHINLAEVRGRHEVVRDALVGGTAREVDRALFDHYVNTDHGRPAAPDAG